MGKRRHTQKKSMASLPKGLPFKKKARLSKNGGSAAAAAAAIASINPFESARASSAKSPKFHVHNRSTSGQANGGNANANININAKYNPTKGAGSALKRAIDNRQHGLKKALDKNKKAGAFIDRRIGESRKSEMTQDERVLARIVRERSRRSKKLNKYSLDGDGDGNDGSGNGNGNLTHGGRTIDESYSGQLDASAVILSDDDEEGYNGQLEKADTELHFGGGVFDHDRRKEATNNPYGPSSGAGAGAGGAGQSMGDRYRSRKEELDDLIMRKKFEKAEKAKHKEQQHEKFEDMDTQFKELASLLNFRDKEKDRKDQYDAKKAGTLSKEDEEMDEWEKEMKGYLFDRKVKATDRTKTPEEIAKEESERLHELETKRLARMNGDFENDDFSDISDDENDDNNNNKKKKKKYKKKASTSSSSTHKNPDELDSDEEESDELETRFTADGLVYVDKAGNVVRKVEVGDGDSDNELGNRFNRNEVASDDDEDEDDAESLGASDDDASVESDDGLSSGDEDMDTLGTILKVGTNVKGKYNAEQQFEGKGKWYKAKITKAYSDAAGNTRYDVVYDDGDIEEAMKPENIRCQRATEEERKIEKEQKEKRAKIVQIQEKRRRAKDKARAEIPYVFEVPTTLEALHDIIGTYAATGNDASLIIKRIHKANSVRLDKRNKEKMQNFCDVLLRRFTGVGDALYKAGNGGDELGRYNQLDSLSRVLYDMAQDSPDSAGAVWGRRIGIFQNAHSKRLRDSELVGVDDNEYTAWPSSGTLFLLRATGHIFPVTDKRHVVITPTLILLGQIIGQSPIRSPQDIIRGIYCSSLMIEFTRDAKRLPTEALSFLAGVINLFSNVKDASTKSPVPSFSSATKFEDVQELRQNLIENFDENAEYRLSLEKEKMNSDSAPVAILIATLQLVKKSIEYYCSSMGDAQIEVFDQITRAVLNLNPGSKNSKFPKALTKEVRMTAEILQKNLKIGQARSPLLRRSTAKVSDLAIQTLAPRMEDPDKYSMAKDKGKTRMQAERDKLRREYRREHKAVSRELRLDSTFIETERRKQKDLTDSKAREERNKNYVWMEQEQATMNQQVALGGGLLKGGGIGAGKRLAKSGKIGIKKGGKLR